MKHLLSITLLACCLLNITHAVNAIEHKEKVIAAQQESIEVISETISEEPMCANPDIINAYYKKGKNNKGYAVFIGNKQAIWFTKDLSSITAQKRAEIVSEKINKMILEGIDPATIKPVKQGNNTFLQAGDEIIVTVDTLNAKSVGVSVHELAYTWANDTRVALGAKPLRKDYADVSRGFTGKESRYLGQKTIGLASWYGPNFHGRRAADGSRFNKEEYTAAHRTYPFGTLVKVTNLRNSKSCVVKITDRGPYAHGRVIDLSKKAAEDIGVSGVVKVKLEVVGQY